VLKQWQERAPDSERVFPIDTPQSRAKRECEVTH
jgi:hypothetical protein